LVRFSGLFAFTQLFFQTRSWRNAAHKKALTPS
jgi:hypothetical protein